MAQTTIEQGGTLPDHIWDLDQAYAWLGHVLDDAEFGEAHLRGLPFAERLRAVEAMWTGLGNACAAFNLMPYVMPNLHLAVRDQVRAWKAQYYAAWVRRVNGLVPSGATWDTSFGFEDDGRVPAQGWGPVVCLPPPKCKNLVPQMPNA